MLDFGLNGKSQALDWAAAEAFGGHYESAELGAMVDREAIINQAIA